MTRFRIHSPAQVLAAAPSVQHTRAYFRWLHRYARYRHQEAAGRAGFSVGGTLDGRAVSFVAPLAGGSRLTIEPHGRWESATPAYWLNKAGAMRRAGQRAAARVCLSHAITFRRTGA